MERSQGIDRLDEDADAHAPANLLEDRLDLARAADHGQKDLVRSAVRGRLDVVLGRRTKALDAAEDAGARGRAHTPEIVTGVGPDLGVDACLPLPLPAPLPVDDDARESPGEGGADSHRVGGEEEEVERRAECCQDARIFTEGDGKFNPI